MVLPDADWKNQPRHVFDWLTVVNAGFLVVIYVYQGWREGEALYIGLAAVLIAMGVVYFSAYWQPILYLLLAGAISIVTVVWLWEGVRGQTLVQAAIGFQVVFVVLNLYLFTSEERT